MTYGELYRLACRELDSDFEAGQLFAHVTARAVAELPFVGRAPAPEREVRLLGRLCARRKEGEPLQYLLGEWEFYGLPFQVGEGVLIPRQDTETLVDTALAEIAGVTEPEMLDLCSGSGCVAIALAHRRPDARVTAVELSPAACGYLRGNIALNGVEVTAVEGDLHHYAHPAPLDLLTANPPYIPSGDIAELQREVHHEPLLALDGGADGLDFYRTIARLYKPQMRPGGRICLEVGAGQSGAVRELLTDLGYENPAAKDDLTGIARVVYARVPGEA